MPAPTGYHPSAIPEIQLLNVELTKITSQLAESNESVILAEQKTKVSHRTTLLVTILGIVIPIIQGLYYDSKSLEKDKELKKLSSTVTQLYLRLSIVENELSKSRKKQLPVKVLKRNIVAKKAKKNS